MSPKENEQDRREVFRRLQQEHLRTEREHAEAKASDAQLAGKLSQKMSELDAALERANLPFPRGNICPNCWYRKGLRRDLVSAIHPDHTHYDLFVCEGCGHEDPRRIDR